MKFIYPWLSTGRKPSITWIHGIYGDYSMDNEINLSLRDVTWQGPSTKNTQECLHSPCTRNTQLATIYWWRARTANCVIMTHGTDRPHARMFTVTGACDVLPIERRRHRSESLEKNAFRITAVLARATCTSPPNVPFISKYLAMCVRVCIHATLHIIIAECVYSSHWHRVLVLYVYIFIYVHIYVSNKSFQLQFVSVCVWFTNVLTTQSNRTRPSWACIITPNSQRRFVRRNPNWTGHAAAAMWNLSDSVSAYRNDHSTREASIMCAAAVAAATTTRGPCLAINTCIVCSLLSASLCLSHACAFGLMGKGISRRGMKAPRAACSKSRLFSSQLGGVGAQAVHTVRKI